MKKLIAKMGFVLMMLLSVGLSAQPDLVCLEITMGGETEVLPVPAEFAADVQTQLTDEGIPFEVVDCDDFDLPDWPDFPVDTTGVPNLDDLICYEIAYDGDTCVIPIPEDLSADFEAQLIADGVSFEIVDCDDLPHGPDFPVDTTGFDDLVCYELTEDGLTYVMPVPAGFAADFEAQLTAEGIPFAVVDCEDLDDPDWPDFPVDTTDYDDLVCYELTEDGFTFVMPIPADFAADFEAQLTAEGIPFAVVDCEDLDDPDWPDFPVDTTDYDDLVCYELTEDGLTYVMPIPADFAADFEAQLVADGVSFEIVDCEDLDEPDWPDFPVDSTDLVCFQITEDGETFILPVPSDFAADLEAQLILEGITYSIVDCDDPTPIPGNTTPAALDRATSISELTVYPNPARETEQIKVAFSSPSDEKVTVRVMNQAGQLVRTDFLNTAKGINQLNLNTSGLGAGFYMISITNGKDLNFNEKLMIID